MSANVTEFKQQAAERAVEAIESGMVVGLGEGSTAIFAVRHVAKMLRTGQLRDIVAIPASLHIEYEACQLDIPLTSLETQPVIDLTIDGADEVDPHLNLIKGGGGALLREKIIAQASKREIIVVDESKLSSQLGTRWALPVEVIPFGWRSQAEFLTSLGAEVTLRVNASHTTFRTDQSNLILDCNFGPISKPSRLAEQLNGRVGIVAHGLFLGLASEVIVAGPDGIRHLTL